MNKMNSLVAALSLVLSACTTTSVTPPAGKASGQQQLSFQLASGDYRCESGLKLEIRRNPANAGLLELNWRGSRYTLQRIDSSSGLPRYEDSSSGLVWIDLPWKSVLMDRDSGRPLANECRALAQG